MKLGDESLDFLMAVWGQQRLTGYCFLAVRSGVAWREIPIHGSRIEEMYTDGIELPDGADVYFCPNTFSGSRRDKNKMLESCWLYADLDECDPRQIPRNLRPDIAWCSSPGRYQALWLMTHGSLLHRLGPDTHQLLNKKLTYRLGADRSGWDATQVLRVPGTVNHKYESLPTVELLWENYRGHDPRNKKWKEVREYKTATKSKHNGSSKLPIGVQQKLLAKVATGDRSRVLWRLEISLLEAGYTVDQVFWTVRPTVWNKFDGNDQALRSEIDRAAARVNS